jgi:hypothetical protein
MKLGFLKVVLSAVLCMFSLMLFASQMTPDYRDEPAEKELLNRQELLEQSTVVSFDQSDLYRKTLNLDPVAMKTLNELPDCRSDSLTQCLCEKEANGTLDKTLKLDPFFCREQRFVAFEAAIGE